MINTVYHSLVKNKKRKGKGSLKETGGEAFLNFLPLHRGWLISRGSLFERYGLYRGFTVVK